MARKRSERGRGAGWVVPAAVCACAGLLVPVGCADVEPTDVVDLERIIDDPFIHETVDLTPRALGERMSEIDRAYAEPRTPKKVEYSYETARSSLSRVNGYGAAWRGVRACAWLAMNHPERAVRRDYATKGIGMGRLAAAKASKRVEPHYYLALCQAALMEIKGLHESGLAPEVEENLKLALVLDASFDHCGAHRELGKLLLQTAPYPLLNVTSWEKKQGGVKGALEHLGKAAASCAEYGENHLMLARALIEAEDYELARSELETVMTSDIPDDRSAEHDRWLNQANELMVDLQGK